MVSGQGVCTWQSGSSLTVSGQRVALAANTLLKGGNIYTGYAVNGVYTNVAFPQGILINPCLTSGSISSDGLVRAVRYTPFQ